MENIINLKCRYVLIFLTVCTYNQSKPMDWLSKYSDNSVITKPYKPSFSARYPRTSNLLKSGLFGGLATTIAYQQDSNRSLAIGAATFATLFAYNASKKPSLPDFLLTDPSKVLHQIYKTEDYFAAKLQTKINVKSSLQEQILIYKKIKKETKKKFPLFLLGECTQGPTYLLGMCIQKPCILSRTYEPEYRKIYENRVIKALYGKSKILQQQPIQYTSFGSGGMFQDLTIITKFLAQNPDAKIDIHLIDLQYAPYCEIRNLLQKNLTIKRKENTDLESKMKEIITFVRANQKVDNKASDDEIKKNVTMYYMQLENRGKQFISYLQKTFPHAHISLCLHRTTDDYFTYLESHKISYPDVIAAADIMDEMSLIKQSTKNYALLCIKALQHKPESTNIWLDKLCNSKENSTQAKIISISLKDPQTIHTEKTELELDKENKVSVYYKMDDITKYSWLELIIKRIFGIFKYA